MTKSNPLITIGITCFNAEDLIINAITHARQQDWPNYEIIIVDDGSSDNSVNLINAYIKDNTNTRLIRHKENKGFPSALNSILQHAKGEYITFFDDDDRSLPDRLTKQYRRLSSFIDAHKTTLVMCYTNRKVEYANQEHPPYNFTAIGSTKGREPHGEIVADYLLWDSGRPGYQWGMFGSCTLMAHRDLYEQIGQFDPQFRRSAEWDMAIRCALKGGHFIAVDEDLVIQTKTPTADKSGKKPLQYALLLREKYKNYLQDKNLYRVARLIAHARFYGGKSQKRKSLCYTLLAASLAPRAILGNKIQKRLSNL